MELVRVKVRETGPLRSRVRIERKWGASTLAEELVLDADSRVLRVNVTLDWREQAHLLKLRFPTALAEPVGTYEIPFGSIERPVDGAEEPGQSWIDLTGTLDGKPAGLTVVTTNKHAYDVSPAGAADGASIGITAVRSPVYSWHDPRLLTEGDVYSFQDQGVQRFSYELVPHAGDLRESDPTRRAVLLEAPVRAMLESSHGGVLPAVHSFASDGGAPVRVTALKGSEDVSDAPSTGRADLIVRAVESRGERTVARIELGVVDRVLEEEFGPNQLRTFRVPRDPSQPVVEVDLIERPLGADAVGEAAPGSEPESGLVDHVGPAPEPGAETQASAGVTATGPEIVEPGEPHSEFGSARD
jgi:alpha-mannosidase